MAKKTGFRLNPKGGAKVLKEWARPRIDALGQKVAAAADGEVSTYTTDRAAASVSVPAERQARDGVLTRAAAAAGLEVRAK